MPNTSRHNISRAGRLFQGSAGWANYEGGIAGIQWTPMFRWRPTGTQPVVFSGALAAGVSSATLNANFGPPTGFYSVTLSNGQVVEAFLTQGATTCLFFNPLPLVGSPLPVTTQSAVTANAIITGQPPVVGTGTQVSASQSVGAAGSALLNGTYLNNVPGSSTQTVGGNVYTGVIVPDVPRNVVAAWTTASVVKVSGFDVYGQAMTEQSASGTTFTGRKAFAIITGITSTAAVTGFTAGFGNVLGLPFTTQSGDFLSPMFNDAADAGTFVARDYTTPATSTTGDPRGTYTPAGTLNGAKFVAAILKVVDTASQAGSFGIIPA